jgi:hypothetical protein
MYLKDGCIQFRSFYLICDEYFVCEDENRTLEKLAYLPSISSPAPRISHFALKMKVLPDLAKICRVQDLRNKAFTSYQTGCIAAGLKDQMARTLRSKGISLYTAS